MTNPTDTANQASAEERTKRKTLEGWVVSDKMDKTRVVRIERTLRHPKYEKVMKRNTKVHAHDEKNEAHEGDRVAIEETRPMSKLKRWRVVRVLEKARVDVGHAIPETEVAKKP